MREGDDAVVVQKGVRQFRLLPGSFGDLREERGVDVAPGQQDADAPGEPFAGFSERDGE